MQPVVPAAFSSNLIPAWTHTKTQVETAQLDIGILHSDAAGTGQTPPAECRLGRPSADAAECRLKIRSKPAGQHYNDRTLTDKCQHLNASNPASMVSVIQHRNHSQFRPKPKLCAVHFTETENRPKLRFLSVSVPKPTPKPNFGRSLIITPLIFVCSLPVAMQLL